MKGYVAEIAALAGIDPEYLTQADAETFLAENDVEPPTELLRHAYDAHVINGEHGFSKTVFHYLLARLGRARDDFAFDHSISLLREHPEESAPVLEYAGLVREAHGAEPALVELLASDDAVYPYQHYMVLRWRFYFAGPPTDEFLAYVRKISRSDRSPMYLQSAARMLLARFGSEADLEAIESSYPTAPSELAKAEVLCALHRMEKGRRNAVLGKSKSDGFLVSNAVKLVKEGRLRELFTHDAA
jgi:hypothetical protein